MQASTDDLVNDAAEVASEACKQKCCCRYDGWRCARLRTMT